MKIKYRGAIDPSISKEVYKNYDIFLLLTKSENYCYAIEESLLCGCPVLISKGTTPWDDVDHSAGIVVDLDDDDSIVNYLKLIGEMSNEDYCIFTEHISDYINTKINFDDLKKNYIKMFNNYINIFKK